MKHLWERVLAGYDRLARMPHPAMLGPLLALTVTALFVLVALVDYLGGNSFDGALYGVVLGSGVGLVVLLLLLDVGIERLFARLPDPTGDGPGVYLLVAACLVFTVAGLVYATSGTPEPALFFAGLGVLALGRYAVGRRSV